MQFSMRTKYLSFVFIALLLSSPAFAQLTTTNPGAVNLSGQVGQPGIGMPGQGAVPGSTGITPNSNFGAPASPNANVGAGGTINPNVNSGAGGTLNPNVTTGAGGVLNPNVNSGLGGTLTPDMNPGAPGISGANLATNMSTGSIGGTMTGPNAGVTTTTPTPPYALPGTTIAGTTPLYGGASGK